jgi:hypothetical protein
MKNERKKLPLARPRRGRLSEKSIENAIKGSLGNVSFIARRLEVTRQIVWRRITGSERLKTLFDEENESMLDNAENELVNVMNPSANEDPRTRLEAVKYYLDHKGKKRGYGRQGMDVNVTTGEDEAPVQPIINFSIRGESGNGDTEPGN